MATWEVRSKPGTPKIIQLFLTPNDEQWQGLLFGLADDGWVYNVDPNGRWVPVIPPLTGKEHD